MGGGDYCAVYGCSSDRRKPEIAMVMNHVGKLRWYGPKNRHTEMAEVTGGGDFKVSMSTKVCSNQFAAG